ncbi:hypothetical protein [Streptomyces sp. TLI_105]|uniref:hypothetical protein n=1 Tax=Streptomyces sp. TLI_105 TaxID=1881019 RepID=UPI0008966BF0|nr:hypothetical protein [Streptomyces sp. TLI_105]SED88215.1 hypothetical protein SAMN05428939_6584 [Streptomyces sp. TLI_105]
MSSNEEPRGHWPSAPAYPPAGPAGRAPDGPRPGAPAHTASHRGAWIGAAATLVAAVIGVVGTYMVGTGNSNQAAPPPARTTTAPAGGEETHGDEGAPSDSSRSPESSAPADSPASPTSPTPAPTPAGTVQWQGALAIAYAESKDLDSTPPEESEINSDNDFSVYPLGSHMLRPESGAKAVVWETSGKVPSYQDCAGVVGTLATTTDMKLKTGLVVCALTNDGRVARLTVKELAGQASDTRGVFDVVVWSR